MPSEVKKYSTCTSPAGVTAIDWSHTKPRSITDVGCSARPVCSTQPGAGRTMTTAKHLAKSAIAARRMETSRGRSGRGCCSPAARIIPGPRSDRQASGGVVTAPHLVGSVPQIRSLCHIDHMLLATFHPAIDAWFSAKFVEPTEPQQRAWPLIQEGRDVLIAAPTGAGKTFAAFLAAIDSLLRQGLDGTLTDETQVVYISPLKALSNDVQKNLSEPLAEIRQTLEGLALPDVEIRTLVRPGDTPQAERQAKVT